MPFQQLYLDIQKKFIALESRVQLLEYENNQFKKENIELKIVNAKLKRENVELKEKLGLNSKNSSISSSKELYKIKKENRLKTFVMCRRNVVDQKNH